MSISFTIPRAFEKALRAEWGDLSQAAKDALIIESYRTGKLSIGDVAQILAFETRIQAEEWLRLHAVALNYSVADLAADRKTLKRLLD